MLTLQGLKRFIEIPEESGRIPTVKYLRNNGIEIVSESLGIDAQITAYRNGYAVYRVGNRSTVISIHSCGDYLYESSGMIVCIGKSYFDRQAWYVRLMLEGEDRLSHNREISESEKNVSYSAVSEEWMIMVDKDKSPLEYIIRNETIHELLSLLTERQRFVVWQFYFCQKTQKEISDELGVTAPSVSRTLSQAIRRMRKNSGKELVESWRGGISYAW